MTTSVTGEPMEPPGGALCGQPVEEMLECYRALCECPQWYGNVRTCASASLSRVQSRGKDGNKLAVKGLYHLIPISSVTRPMLTAH